MVTNQQIYCILAGCGHHFLNGIVVGWTSPIIPKLLDPDQSPFGRVLTEYEIALINLMALCVFTTMLLSGPTTKRFGRKPVLVIAAFVRGMTWLATAFNTNVKFLYVLKVLEAQAIGFTLSTAFVYISEVVSVDIRGLALTCISVSLNLGILTIYAIGPFVSYKMVAVIASCCCLIVFTLLMFIPESHVYYLSKGDKEKANKCLMLLNGVNHNVEKEMEQYDHMIKCNEELKPYSNLKEFKELFTVKKNLKVFFITLVIFNLPEFSGMMACLFNMTNLFQASGSSVPPHIASIIVAVIQLLPCMLGSLLIERVGRRILLLTSLAVCAVLNLIMGVMFYLEHIKNPIVEYITWLPLGNMICFILFFNIGLGTVPGSYLGELLDPRVKSLGTSIITAITSISLNTTVSLFRLINTHFGNYTTFWIFASCCAFGFLFVKTLVPETKGKSFIQIQNMMN